jgi:hypothetical protein
MVGLLAIATGAVDAQAATPLRLLCRASGSKLVVPAMADAAVCERFRASLSAILKASVRLSPASPGPADGVSAVLRFAKPGVATVSLTDMRGARSTVYPPLSIAVTDRAMGTNEIDELAKQAATMLTAKRR